MNKVSRLILSDSTRHGCFKRASAAYSEVRKIVITSDSAANTRLGGRRRH